MALNCKLSERIFTFEGKDYSYAQFQALLAEGLLARIPELTAAAKETLATEEGRAEVEQGLSLDEARRRLMEMRDEREESDKSKSLRRALISVVGRMTEERAKKMARLLAPKLTIVRHSTSESLMAAHPQGSDVDGFYDYAKQVIHVGPRGNATHIIAHELLHPIFDNFIGVDEAKTARLYDELVKDERLVGFVEFGKNYLSKKDPSDITGIERSKVEALVDYLGAVADGKFDKELLGDSKFMQGVKEMLYRIMEFFGAKRPVVDITDVQTLKDLAKAIAIASKYGRAVKYVEKDIDIDGVEGSMSEYPRSRAREIRFGSVSNLYAGEDADLDGLERDRQIMAEGMEARGEDPEEIRATTGWFRGKYDNKWRKEIDDSEAVLLDDWKDIPVVNEYADAPDVKLSEVLDHKKLYEKYPEARDIKFSVRDLGITSGTFNRRSNEIELNYSNENPLSTILHEVQHWIQSKEGFDTGGNSLYAVQNASLEILQEGISDAIESIQYRIKSAEKIKPIADFLSKVMLPGIKPGDEELDALFKNDFLRMLERGSSENYQTARDEAIKSGIDPDSDPNVVEKKKEMNFIYNQYSNYLNELLDAIGIDAAEKIGLELEEKRRWDGSKFVDTKEISERARFQLRDAVKYGYPANEKVEKEIEKLKSNLSLVKTDKSVLAKELERTPFASELYKRISGEIEARDVQAREKLSEEERRQTAPYSSENIPKERAIFVDEGVSEMRADEGRVVPNEEYKKALDAAFKTIEETSEKAWSSLSNSEQATRMADAAVAAMKKSDWFKGQDIKQQRAAIKELRNEIADRLGVKLAPKTEKQQQKAEEAAFKKGEKEGWKQAKEKAKEQAKRLKEKIVEALAAAKEGRETIKEKEKELTEAQKKEQKRIDKAYAVGLAEGKLGGEIFGKQKGREEGRKEMTKEQRLARKNFVAAVRAAMVDEDGKLIIKGKVGAAQAMAIGSKAAKVDPMNSEQVAKFIDYVQKVIADAQYDQKVDRAKEAKRQLKKLAKSNKPSVIRSAAYDLSIVDIDMIDSLDEYIKMAEKVVAAGKSPSSDAYKMVNVEEVDELMTEIEDEIAENYKQLLIDEYGIEGISASDAKELYKFIEDEEGFNDLYNSLEEDKKQKLSNIFNAKAERAKSELEEWAKDNGILGLMVGRKFSESQVQVVKDLLGANVKNMTNAQKSLYIRAVDNLIVNDNFGGTTKVAAIAWASNKAKAAFDKFGSIFKKFNVGSKFEDARKGVLSMPDLNTMFFGRSLKVGEVQVKMGLDMFRRGRQKAQEISDQIAKEQTDFYTDLHKKYPQAAKPDNLSAEGMVAYVIQKSPAFSLEESLEINKSIFQESIDVLKGSNKPKDNKQAEVLQGLFDAFVKNAKTREEILNNLKQFSPGNYESLMFLIGQHKKHKEAIKEANELNWDSPDASNDWSFEYYLPIRYDFTSAEPDFAEKNANAQLALSMRPGTMKKPVQSFGLRRRQRYTKLPKNSVVNLNIRRNSFNSLASNTWDASVTPALYRIQEFLKTPDAVNLFGGGSMGEQNAKFYVEVLDKWVNRYADAYKATEVEKGLNRAVNGVRRLTTAYALGGLVDPILKQGADPILATFMLTGGDKRILGNLFIQAGDGPQRLMSNYSIGSRGANAAYREWQGKVSSQIDKLERAISNSQWKKVENIYRLLLDNTMRTTGVTDAITARASWMTWYEKAREQQGHKIKDWGAEADNINSDEDRQAAAMFAETMVGRSLAVSDPAEASSLAQKGKSLSINMVKAVFFPFSGFNIQKWSRKVQDFADLHRAISSGDPEAKKEAGPALRSLVTSFVQDVVFSAMTNFAIPKLRNVMGLLILQTLVNAFVDEEDDEEKVNLLESYIQWVAVFRAFGIAYSDVDRWFKEARNILQEQITDKQVENIKNTFFAEKDKEKITLAYEIGKQTEKEKKAAIAVKKSYTQWTTSLLMTDISPQLSDATIHAINSAYYSLLVSTKDPSVYNKDGEVKKFAQWAKDETNLALWKYGADKDIFSAGGLFDIVAKIPSTLSRQIEESEKNIEEAKWYYLYPKSGETKEQYNIRIKEETEKIKQNMLKDGVKPDVAQYTVDNALDLASEAWVNEGGSDELKEMKRKLISIMENDMKKKEQ